MDSLQNHFLIAMPSMDDPYFSRSVTYICEHDKGGAMGIVINQPVGISLKELVTMADAEATVDDEKAENIVVAGGPISQDRGFILHSTQPGWSSSIALTSDIMITTSKDILTVIGNTKAPQKSVVALGYAGWESGQLEQEIQDNAWLTIEADTDLLFNVPIHLKWQTAVNKLGIDSWQIAPDVGHA